MTDGQTYYDGLIQQGYPNDQALTYTQQYYPGFAPMNLAMVLCGQFFTPAIDMPVGPRQVTLDARARIRASRTTLLPEPPGP